jgi:hypothetical protein
MVDLYALLCVERTVTGILSFPGTSLPRRNPVPGTALSAVIPTANTPLVLSVADRYYPTALRGRFAPPLRLSTR